MASLAQLTANRLNAQRSTGPRTEEGKSASRFNALKHGIEARSLVIPGEDPAELEALALDYYNQLQPVGPVERFFVDSIVHADWDRRRYTRIEGQILQAAMSGNGASSFDALTGKAAQLVFRRLAYAERLYFRSLKELRRAQKERQAQEAEEGEALGLTPAPSPQLLAPAPAPGEVGFVPSDSPQIPARPPALPPQA